MAIRYHGRAIEVANKNKIHFGDSLVVPDGWGDVEGITVRTEDGVTYFPKHAVEGDRLVSVWEGRRIIFHRLDEHWALIELV